MGLTLKEIIIIAFKHYLAKHIFLISKMPGHVLYAQVIECHSQELLSEIVTLGVLVPYRLAVFTYGHITAELLVGIFIRNAPAC